MNKIYTISCSNEEEYTVINLYHDKDYTQEEFKKIADDSFNEAAKLVVTEVAGDMTHFISTRDILKKTKDVLCKSRGFYEPPELEVNYWEHTIIRKKRVTQRDWIDIFPLTDEVLDKVDEHNAKIYKKHDIVDMDGETK